jgi:hypothetical protein
MSGSETVLPPLYARWLEPVLGTVRGEPRSTCERCAMVAWPEVTDPIPQAFQPNVKCCSYQPELYNFNAGRVLADSHPLGEASRAYVRKRIAERAGVTPLSIASSAVYRTIYENSTGAFGRSMSLRCPHYVDKDGGLCGIWQHREAVCTTYFCKYEHGAMGRVWWRVMTHVLSAIELSLKMWVIREAGLDDEAQADLWSRQELERRGARPQLDEAALANAADVGRYRKDWANFFEREEEFFRRCAEIVEGLEWDDIARIGGTSVTSAVHTARHVRSRIENLEIPEHARLGPNVFFTLRRPGEVCVRHQGVPLDWLDVPEGVARKALRFHEAPVKEVVAEMRAEGTPIDDQLLRKLVEWQVLNKA